MRYGTKLAIAVIAAGAVLGAIGGALVELLRLPEARHG